MELKAATILLTATKRREWGNRMMVNINIVNIVNVVNVVHSYGLDHFYIPCV